MCTEGKAVEIAIEDERIAALYKKALFRGGALRCMGTLFRFLERLKVKSAYAKAENDELDVWDAYIEKMWNDKSR